MNRQPSSKPARRAVHSRAGFTLQQITILVIVAVLGLAALSLAAYLLLFQAPAAPQPMPAKQPAAAAVPSASTPLPQKDTPQAPVLPAACLQKNSGIQQGESARVIDSGTIEAQVSGSVLRFALAGIQIPNTSPLNEQALSSARALIDGQEILLVQDPASTTPDGSAALPRYILVGDQFVNLNLVQQGLGQADPNVPEQVCANLFLQAEQQARAEKIGLWQPKRVPTATFIPFVTLDPSRDAPCDCISRPECSQFKTHAEAQACFNACNDYNSKLDEDRDGIACEELP